METNRPDTRRADFAFCPRDGSPLEQLAKAEGRVRPTCKRCGFVDWANPKPCVGVLTVRGGRLLLARRGVDPAKGEWDIPGGFIDAGETGEQAALREMSEETGLAVRLTGYFGSFPDTYGPSNEPTLNLFFTAEAPAGDPKPKSDVAELRWFLPSELPHKMAFTHQPEVLRRWRDAAEAQAHS